MLSLGRFYNNLFKPSEQPCLAHTPHTLMKTKGAHLHCNRAVGLSM